MREQKIQGNICPYIKRAIQECLKLEKHQIDKIWIDELTEKSNGSTKLMAVSSNALSYVKIMSQLINTYKKYEESVETIVEIWKPMLSGSESLAKTFNMLIMTEFDESIWSDRNIKVVIEEIMQHTDSLLDHQDKLSDITKISESLENIKQSYNVKQDSSNKTKKSVQRNENDSNNSTGCSCMKCMNKNTINKKKKQKSKPEFAGIKNHK